MGYIISRINCSQTKKGIGFNDRLDGVIKLSPSQFLYRLSCLDDNILV